MRFWRKLLGGLILWTAHFFAVYGIASILPGTALARWLVVAATIVALAIAWWRSAQALRALRRSGDDLQRWSDSLALLGYAVAGAAITYQGLPAVVP